MIDSVGNNQISKVQRAGDAAVRRVETGGAARSEASVGVRATSGSIVTDIAAAPAPVDSARVAGLRAAIAEGRYAIDAGAIARAIVG